MNSKLIKYHSFIVLIMIIIGILFWPLLTNLKYGLDLQGGFEILYLVKPLDDQPLTKEMVNNTYKTMLKRIDVLGVSEPDIIIEGHDRIRVQLAGVTNKDEARDVLSKVASLTFRDVFDNLLMASDVLEGGGAKLSADQYGKPAVALAIKDKDKFYQVTNKIKDYQDNRIVIWLDFEEGYDSFSKEEGKCGLFGESKCLSAAFVSQAFTSDVIIQGSFTKEEATNLVELINSGSLPTKLEAISSRSIGSLFGDQTLTKTLIAGIVGLGLILVFLFIIYRYVGLIASLGLILYTFLVLLILWLIGGVLTLPGITSLLLGIGMAIDAAVISFERIKEKLRNKLSLKEALREGYQQSFTSIMDANITTIIAALIMFIFGESSIKGFATVLIISTIVTILVMVYLVKYIVILLAKTNYFNKKMSLFINYKERKAKATPTNLFKMYKIFMPISLLIIMLAIFFFFTKSLNLSIDYTGGTYINLTSEHKLSLTELKKDLKDFNLQYNDLDYNNDHNIYLKLDKVLTKNEISKVETYFTEKYQAQSEIGVVSNIVKKELTLNAFYAMILASLGMLIYLSIRFKFNYAVSALITLIHDVLIVTSIFVIFHLEISIIFIAALLAIIGYSINDTVVIFDRIREKIKEKAPKDKSSLKELVNDSLRVSLLRNIYTSLTTALPVICLLILGANAIFNFNLALLIGLVVGTYSSLFLASQLWYLLECPNIGVKKKEVIFKDELDELEIKGINK